MKKYAFFWVLGFAILMLNSQCHKNECKNYSAIKADFNMLQETNYSDTPFFEVKNGDTTRGGEIIFEAKDSTANSYEWKVGTDTRTFTGRQLKLEFDARSSVQGAIVVRLIAKKTSNSMCDPLDDGIDTISKKFYLLDQTVVFGDYEGYLEANPSDKFTISLITKFFDDFVDNYPKGCIRDKVSRYGSRFSYSHRIITFGGENPAAIVPCPDIHGWAYVDYNNNVTMYVEHYDLVKQKYVKNIFKGKKR